MKGKIGGIYNALQGLDIKPTPENARILTAVYNTLQDIYLELESKEAEQAHGGTEPGPERGAE